MKSIITLLAHVNEEQIYANEIMMELTSSLVEAQGTRDDDFDGEEWSYKFVNSKIKPYWKIITNYKKLKV